MLDEAGRRGEGGMSREKEQRWERKEDKGKEDGRGGRGKQRGRKGDTKDVERGRGEERG